MNADCRDIRPLLSPYMDNDLDPAEVRAVQAHVAGCAACAAILAEYRELRSAVCALPQPVPPVELRRAVFARATPAYRRRAFLLDLGQRGLAYGALAVAVVAVLLTASLFLRSETAGRLGLDNTAPQITGYFPDPSTSDWGLGQPVQITFSEEMDQTSILAALTISADPPISEAERQRLLASARWDKTTLIIGGLENLAPYTDYTITIDPTKARDKAGNRLQAPALPAYTVRTADVVASAPTPTQPPAVPTVTPTPPPANAVAPWPSATPSTAPSANPTAAAAIASGASATAAPAPASAQPSSAPAVPPTSRPSIPPTATTVLVGPPAPTATPVAAVAPTATTAPPSPTATLTSSPSPSPSPSATPSATPTTSPTVTPAASPTAKPTEQPSPSPSPTPAATATTAPPIATPTPKLPYPVVNGFGQIYTRNATVRDRLGLPTASEGRVQGAYQAFEGGLMFWRSDTHMLYVLFNDSSVWYGFADGWTEGMDVGGGTGPAAGQFLPKRGFGKVWREQPDVQKRLGYALSTDETAILFGVQPFERGLMLWSNVGDQPTIYVLYQNNLFERYPDVAP